MAALVAAAMWLTAMFTVLNPALTCRYDSVTHTTWAKPVWVGLETTSRGAILPDRSPTSGLVSARQRPCLCKQLFLLVLVSQHALHRRSHHLHHLVVGGRSRCLPQCRVRPTRRIAACSSTGRQDMDDATEMALAGEKALAQGMPSHVSVPARRSQVPNVRAILGVHVDQLRVGLWARTGHDGMSAAMAPTATRALTKHIALQCSIARGRAPAAACVHQRSSPP